MANPRTYNVHKTKAVLVGIDAYDLSVYNGDKEAKNRVEQAIRNSVKRFDSVCSELLGIKSANKTKILSGTSDDILRKTRDAFSEATQTVLFYFCGHAITNNGELYLGLNGLDINSPNIGGLEMSELHEELNRSPAEIKVVILDCCFAGAGFEGESLGSSSELMRANVNARNTFGLAASAAGTLALVPKDSEYTALTGALCDVLERGIESDKLYLSLDDIYQAVRAICSERNYPRPVRVSSIDDDIAIAKNKMYISEEGEAARAIPRFYRKIRLIETKIENLRRADEKGGEEIDDIKHTLRGNTSSVSELQEFDSKIDIKVANLNEKLDKNIADLEVKTSEERFRGIAKSYIEEIGYSTIVRMRLESALYAIIIIIMSLLAAINLEFI